MKKRTVILGASENPSSYAYLAAQNLSSKGHEIIPLSIHHGNVLGKAFLQLEEKPLIPEVDTITLYINPYRQINWEEYILSLDPKRIIFNPGTENSSLIAKAEQRGVEAVIGCTLVMLNTGQY